jgi:hypothetical protein
VCRGRTVGIALRGEQIYGHMFIYGQGRDVGNRAGARMVLSWLVAVARWEISVCSESQLSDANKYI